MLAHKSRAIWAGACLMAGPPACVTRSLHAPRCTALPAGPSGGCMRCDQGPDSFNTWHAARHQDSWAAAHLTATLPPPAPHCLQGQLIGLRLHQGGRGRARCPHHSWAATRKGSASRPAGPLHSPVPPAAVIMTARCCRQPVFRLTKPVPHRLQGPAFGLCRPGQSALIILRCQSSLAAVNLTVTLLPPA